MSFENEVIQAEFRTVSSSKTLKEIESISNAILKLKRETEGLEKQKKEAAVQYGSNSKQVKELTAQIKANNAQLALHKSKLEDAQKKLKVTEMSSKQLKDRLAELKRAMDAVNKEAFPDRWNKLNTAYKETSAQLNKVTNGSNAVKKGVGSIMSYAKGLLPAFGFSAVIGGVMSLSKELFQLAMQMKSDNIRNTTIFGESLSYVEKEASRLSKAMGLTNREFVSNAASSADLLKPLGFTSEQAAKLSVRMQELAGPLAEWSKGKYNAAQITEVMNGAMTGEMERLKGLGIIIQQSAPEYQNMVKLKQKEEKCSLDQAKALATLELMYQKSIDAQTAYAAGGNQLLRRWEGLKATWRGAKEWMVELFSDSVTDGLEKQRNYVNALAVQLTNTNTSTAERVKILNQLKSINPDIVEGLSAENLEMGKLRENLDKYNSSMLERISLEKTNKDVEKKAQKYGEANSELGRIGAKLSHYMNKLSPDIAIQNIPLEDKLEQLHQWRKDQSIKNRMDNSNTYKLMSTYARDYRLQRKKVQKLQTEYNESLKEMEVKKEMMIFPTTETQKSPINRLEKKGKDKNENPNGDESPKSLLAIQQDKLTNAQKARNEATDTETLAAWNQEIEAINGEISRLQGLGKTNPQKIALMDMIKIDDNIDLSEFEAEVDKQVNAWELYKKVQSKFNIQIDDDESTQALDQLEEFYSQKLLSDEEYLSAKQLLNDEARIKQNAIEAEEKLEKAKTEEEEWQAEIELETIHYEEKMLLAGENRQLQLQAEKEHQNALQKIKDKQLNADINRINKEKALQLERISYMAQVAGIVGSLAQENTALARTMFLVDKACAIADIIINLQKEIALHAVHAASMGPILGPPYLAAMKTKATIRSGISIASIAAQAITGFKAGGFTSSAASDDEEAGIVHANEFVATADAVRNPTVLPVLRMIDKAQREGTVRTLDLSALGRTSPIGGNTVSTSVSDNPGFTTTNTAADPEMKELLRRNIEMMQILAEKRIEIPWYGKGGIDEKMKKATKYEQQITSTR